MYWIDRVISGVYAFAAFVLFGIGVLLLIWSLFHCIAVLPDIGSSEALQELLQAIGAIIISIAVIDVSKYLIEEEVFRNKELRAPGEARKTLTKVFVIISIAVSLEGLVFVFKAGVEDMSSLIYPTLLLLAGTFAVVGLGVYQRLSVDVEEKALQRDSLTPEDKKT